MPDSFSYAILCLLSFASLGVWWTAIVRWRNGEPLLIFQQRADMPLELIPLLASLLIWQLVQLFAVRYFGLTGEPLLRNVQVSCLAGGLTVLGIAAVLFAGGGYRPMELGMGLRNWRGDLRDGGIGFLAAVLPVALVLAATLPFRSEEASHSFLRLLREHPDWETIGWIVLSVVVIAPLMEELLFRVVLQGALTKQLGAWPAILLVSVGFALVHRWPDSLPLIPLAVVLGYVYHRRHSYLAVVVMHAIFNATNLLFTLSAAENAPGGR